ncbi:sigma-70 family RNA polymerase sigma factor [Aquibacillus koreensis]|uniref:sigma-70 family RNA polymerase sigma factor n=1 Tax=Aquibacillus koreensis TaxID=279446 RepID=UPI0021A82E37|nr:sigma-70 family RNA polymerase sigma factor [Aquibacillus koreensis]MCT2534904.1 sigma-70 family RNA polymerase sigma factor [Aquibacillus koreensis]
MILLRDEDVFDSLLEEYGESVKRLIFLYVRDKAITDDLTQEVFIKVFSHMNTFEHNSSYKTWIYRIAINQCKDYFRSWTYRKIIFNPFIEKTNDNTPEQILIREDEKSLLTQAILSLPIKYREIIILFYYNELKMKEISNILQVNESTVKTRISRARNLLKKKLGGVYLE